MSMKDKFGRKNYTIDNMGVIWKKFLLTAQSYEINCPQIACQPTDE